MTQPDAPSETAGTAAAQVALPVDAVPVLWRDAGAAAVSKPSGVLSHNSTWAGPRERALVQVARDTLGRKVWLVQRLDRGTSGVLLVTFAPELVQGWVEAVAAGRKRYLAVVRGRLHGPAWVDKALKDDTGVVRAARTAVQPVAVSSEDRVSLVVCTLEHGRIHQARRHLNRLSHPVVGDSNHGDTRFSRAFRERWGVPRLLLHASVLELAHPETGEALRLEAPLPTPMAALIDRVFGLSAAEVAARVAGLGPMPPAPDVADDPSDSPAAGAPA